MCSTLKVVHGELRGLEGTGDGFLWRFYIGDSLPNSRVFFPYNVQTQSVYMMSLGSFCCPTAVASRGRSGVGVGCTWVGVACYADPLCGRNTWFGSVVRTGMVGSRGCGVYREAGTDRGVGARPVSQWGSVCESSSGDSYFQTLPFAMSLVQLPASKNVVIGRTPTKGKGKGSGKGRPVEQRQEESSKDPLQTFLAALRAMAEKSQEGGTGEHQSSGRVAEKEAETKDEMSTYEKWAKKKEEEAQAVRDSAVAQSLGTGQGRWSARDSRFGRCKYWFPEKSMREDPHTGQFAVGPRDEVYCQVSHDWGGIIADGYSDQDLLQAGSDLGESVPCRVLALAVPDHVSRSVGEGKAVMVAVKAPFGMTKRLSDILGVYDWSSLEDDGVFARAQQVFDEAARHLGLRSFETQRAALGGGPEPEIGQDMSAAIQEAVTKQIQDLVRRNVLAVINQNPHGEVSDTGFSGSQFCNLVVWCARFVRQVGSPQWLLRCRIRDSCALVPRLHPPGSFQFWQRRTKRGMERTVIRMLRWPQRTMTPVRSMLQMWSTRGRRWLTVETQVPYGLHFDRCEHMFIGFGVLVVLCLSNQSSSVAFRSHPAWVRRKVDKGCSEDDGHARCLEGSEWCERIVVDTTEDAPRTDDYQALHYQIGRKDSCDETGRQTVEEEDTGGPGGGFAGYRRHNP